MPRYKDPTLHKVYMDGFGEGILFAISVLCVGVIMWLVFMAIYAIG